MDKISVIIPCFNEEASLPFYKEEILKVILQMSSEEFELLFINEYASITTERIIPKYSDNSVLKYCGKYFPVKVFTIKKIL